MSPTDSAGARADAHGSSSARRASSFMERGWIRGAFLTLAIGASIWIGIAASSLGVDARGVATGTIALSTSTGSAAIVLLGLFAVATVIAAAVGRLVNAVVGLFVLGAVLTAFSMRTGAISSAVFDSASLSSIGIEALLWTLPVAIGVVVVFRVAGPLPDVPPRHDEGPWWREYFDLEALRASLVGGLLPIVAWLLVRSVMKGQAIGGACVGGIAVGMAFRLVAPRIQPAIAFISPILLMGGYQWFVASRLRVGADALFAATLLPPELCVMPLDTVAGTLLGVAIGIGWARSFRKTDTIHS